MNVPHESLSRFCAKVLEAVGMERDHALTTATVLVETDSRGILSHGVSLLPTYVRRLRTGLTNAHPKIALLHERGATAAYDADFGQGHVAGTIAMASAIERAGEHGIGLVTVRRSTHYGMAGYYAMMALQHGMIGFTTSNAGADMVPWQGVEPALGNNPVAYAIPARRFPAIVLDMACSVAARGRIRVAQWRGERIPRGWVVGDLEDPAAAYGAPLLPFGAHKGSGLAVVNEVLSAVLPAARLSIEIARSGPVAGETRDPRGIGHTFLAIDIAALRPVDEFLDSVDELIGVIKATPPAPGYDEVLVPGEIEHRNRERALQEGISLPAELIAQLHRLGDEVGIALP
jgi:LDH2 family malate/lactate/ureidoglycolate dehydrogenase